MPLDRDALYYPYIEIQSVNWLKATLLTFPHVRRIVPGGYWPDDHVALLPYLKTKGVGGRPLLTNENPDDHASIVEQERLAMKIENDAGLFTHHFSEAAARKRYPRNWNRYRIYYNKIHYRLRDTLEHHRLSWESEPGWYSLHPRLGRAVMATLAIAIANDRGLDIVTSDDTAHRSVCTQNQDDVFDELLGTLRPKSPSSSPEVVDELAELFMTTFFDVSRLSAEQIVELQKDGKDLRQFKEAILPIAQAIPDIPNLEERNRRLQEGAAEIYDKWMKYKKSLPRFFLETIYDITELKLPAGAVAALGAATYWPSPPMVGIAVGFTTFAGWRIWRKHQGNTASPFQYLNRIHKAGATLAVPTRVSTFD